MTAPLYPIVNLAGGEVIVLIVCVGVCVCVCYRSSGRYAYSTAPTKVPKESARHKDQFKNGIELKLLSSDVMTVCT